MQAKHARQCGHVLRYHTTRTVQQQRVAEHTWHVMRIWWQCYGPMPAQISTYLLFHDAGEVGPGDVPHHAKKNDPLLKAHLDAAEEAALEYLVPSITLHLSGLSERNRLRAKACDMIEVIEFCVEDKLLGNLLGDVLATDAGRKLKAVFFTMQERGYPEDFIAVERYLADFNKRMTCS